MESPVNTTCMVPDVELFLHLPDDEPGAPLHPTRVVDVKDATISCAALAPIDGLTEGGTLTVYFHLDGEFMKQPAAVRGTSVEDLFVADLELLGEPVSAEQRQTFRVSCVGCDIQATVGDERFCKVVDISATGFAVYADQDLRIGDIVPIVVHYDGKNHAGRASVQSVRRIASRVMRYGLSAVGGTGDKGLAGALPRVNAAVQRERMRRTS